MAVYYREKTVSILGAMIISLKLKIKSDLLQLMRILLFL